MTLRQELNQVGEKPLPHGVYRENKILVSMRSPRRVEELFFLLRWKPTIRSSENLDRKWSFSLILLLLPLFPPPTEIWSKLVEWDVLSCHVSPSHWLLDYTLSTYPNLWIFFLLSCDPCPTWVPLRLLFDLLSI